MVRLSDINGPRGGADKCCHIQVVLPQLPDVVIEDTEVDLYAAIDRAADRAGRTVDRRLARHRDRARHGGHGGQHGWASLFAEEEVAEEFAEAEARPVITTEGRYYE